MAATPSAEESVKHSAMEVEQSKRAKPLLPLFFLRSLQVDNFRAIESANFTFQPGLNVIIGANNAAKTAVIDALRIVLNLGTFEKKDDLIRLRSTDVFTDGSGAVGPVSITFRVIFYGHTGSNLTAQFYEMLCLGERPEPDVVGKDYSVFKLLYRVDFEYSQVKGRYEYVRSELRGGPHLANPVSRETLDSVRAIYLAPSRDLVNDRARVGAEIERLLISHTPGDKEDQRKAIPDELNKHATRMIEEVTGNAHHAAAGKNLSNYAKAYGIGDDSLSFVPSGISGEMFSTMATVFSHSLHGAGKLPLSSNGLGINQLIYASIVLSRRGEADADKYLRRFFLIEEPEAHLHPQLQDAFFHTLNEITDHQLFVTSHSPTITAKTDLDKIIVMRRDDATERGGPLHLAEVFNGRGDDKRYLHKFLDVTRSQLLFAKGAIFVEGITEAMLMQKFSEIVDYDLRNAAVEIVVIDSAYGYEHFRPLFDHGGDAYCRAVFITDGDESASAVATDDQIRNGDVDFLDKGLEVTGCTGIATGYGTFEFGLLRASLVNGGNTAMQTLLLKSMEAAAPAKVVRASQADPDAAAKFAKDFMDTERPSLAYRKMKEKKKGTYGIGPDDWYGSWSTNGYFRAAKSDFAFYLYEALARLSLEDAKACFVVPKYIEDAIKFVVRGSAEAKEKQDASHN